MSGSDSKPPTQGELFALDELGEDDAERTAPMDPPAAARPAPAPDLCPDDPGDTSTRFGASPPPVPESAPASPPQSAIVTGEETGRPPVTPDPGSAPPPVPAAPAPPVPEVPRLDSPSQPRDVAAELGLESTEIRPMQLVRVAPRNRAGERVDLDPLRTSYGVGRAESNEVRLYTASASREHARIYVGPSGHWVIEPLPDRSITIDDDPTGEPVPLEENMNLVLGQDHLRFVPPAAGSVVRRRPRVAESRRPSRRALIAAGLGVVLLLAAFAAGWFLR